MITFLSGVFSVKEQLVPIFRVADARKAADWYAWLEFELEGEHQFAPNLPIYAFLRRGDILLHLSEHSGDATPNTLVYFYVNDVDAVAREFDVAVKMQPWCREISLTDPDGNRLRVGTRTEFASRHVSTPGAQRFELATAAGPTCGILRQRFGDKT